MEQSVLTLDDKKVYFFLILACLLVYANSLSGDFVFDDTAQIVTNQTLESWGNIINGFTKDVWSFERESGSTNIPPPYYRPLFTLYLTVGYQLFGLWEQGWHLLNLAIHIGATLLVYRLFLRLSEENLRLSFVGSLFFALIPVHVESISWISGIPDPLAALFYIPSMLFYMDWRENGNKKYLIFSLLAFFGALLCKETPIVLPAILFIWELTLNRKKESGNGFFSAIKQVLIFAAPAVIYLLMRISVLGKVSWKHPFISQTPTEYIFATIPYVLVHYLKNILFPLNLSLIYDTHFVKGGDDSNLWIPLIILLVIGGLIYFFRRKFTPLMWLSLGLFIVPLMPVLNLQVFHYEYIVQDRYLYLPSIGFVLLLAILIEKLWTAENQLFHKIAVAVTVIICLGYTIGTIKQNRMWNSAINLWSRAIEMKPTSWSAYYNLGLAHQQNKEYEKAIDDLDKSLQFQSFNREDSLIYNNRGLAKKALGRTEEAKKDFLKSLEIDPKSIQALTNLGVLYFDQGNYVEAENQFKKGLQTNANDPFVNYNLARTWAKLNRHKEALSIYEKLLQTSKSNPELMVDSAVSYSASGQTNKAKALLTEANRLARDEKLKQQIADEMQKLK
ncbi:MAG TPA: tetratricopeptide repeat protein [Pyrinomonadaceae bacterium]|nr:tetratricopeptide repeat protein [Pyrinomonadaceae bacterium]